MIQNVNSAESEKLCSKIITESGESTHSEKMGRVGMFSLAQRVCELRKGQGFDIFHL